MVVRGEIWMVNLEPAVGREITKSRPCAVISPPEMHAHLRTVIVAPMTTKSKATPFRIAATHAGKKGSILLDQIRAVDKGRLIKKLGSLSPKVLEATLDTLREVFAD